MKLLKSVPDILRSPWPWDAATAALWFVVLGALESLGPHLKNDLGDFCVLLVLISLVVLTNIGHQRREISWVRALAHLLKRLFARMKALAIQVGPDLREWPPITRGTPRILKLLLGCATGLLVLSASLLPWMPGGLRELGLRSSYLGYIAILFLLWGALLSISLCLVFLAFALVHDHLVRRFSGQKGRAKRPEFFFVGAGAALLFVAGLLLPAWIPVALTGVFTVVPLLALLLPGHPKLHLLFRRTGQQNPARSFDWRVGLGLEISTVGMSLLALQLLGRGQELLGVSPLDHGMLATHLLSCACAWVGAGSWCIVGLWYLNWVRAARNGNPARPHPIRLLLESVPKARQKELKEALRCAGFAANYDPAKKRRGDIEVATFFPPIDDPQAQAELSWPPSYTPEQLLHVKTLQSLRQRHELNCRRILIKGLSRLFKLAARRSFESGDGYWVAPHLWFMVGLQRDSEEERKDLEEGTLIEETIGPSYAKLLPLGARHHFYEVMRGLEVDMIFVEDGVDFRRFKRVLRKLFELHDRPEKQAARDRDFNGLPGTRVLIHVLEPTKDVDVGDYPEPNYDILGRASVLHVYRDRGSEESDVPIDLGQFTVPAGVS